MPSARKIVILGGGSSGWMCAAALGKLAKRDLIDVRLVESDEIGTVGVGEATLPHIRAFNALVGVDETELLRRTQATFKLGIEFSGWGRAGAASYIHPFGVFGETWGGADFHHHWLRARQAGLTDAPLEAFCLPIVAARAGRFDVPASDPGSIRSRYDYAYHFDAALYGGLLRELAQAQGVQRIEGQVVDVRLDPTTGDIRSLTLKSGELIEGDLYVDCSGFRARLIGEALKVGWDDWSRWLPCDRAWAVPTERTEAFGAYTRSIAMPAGWRWRIPLQHRTGNGYVFSSRDIDEEAARTALLAELDAPALAEPRLLRFNAGRRVESWAANCVAIGLSSGFLEPLESTSLYLVQVAVMRLAQLLSAAPVDPRARAEFNRSIDLEYDRIRDFLILHYHANGRDDSDLWRRCRTMEVPESLTQKIALFRSSGVLPNYREGLFAPASWLSVFQGQGVGAQRWSRLADGLPIDRVAEKLDQQRRRIKAAAADMASHESAVRLRAEAA